MQLHVLMHAHPDAFKVQHVHNLCMQDVPEDITAGFHVDFVWRGTSFDRMRNALATFRKYSASISGYLYHTLLGHPVEHVSLKVCVV